MYEYVTALNWGLYSSANLESTSFAARPAVVAEPSGFLTDGATNLELQPFGAGSDDATFEMKVIGWRQAGNLWIPSNIAHLAVVLCTSVGVVGYQPADTDRFADAITATTGTATLPTVTANSPARCKLDIKGFKKIEIIFDMTGATSGNTLYAFY